MQRLMAEMLGTLFLVLVGCGVAIMAAGAGGVGMLGVALAFGLTLVAMAYTVGPISGCHLNPAVTVGLWVSGRFDAKDVVPYILAQCVGAAVGAGALFMIASGAPDFAVGGFASNGFAEHSPGGYSMQAVLMTEIIMTALLVIVILGTTSNVVANGFAPLAIGLTLTAIHLVSLPVSATSVNPARSLGTALFADGWAMDQLWLFWVAPLAGAILASLVYRMFSDGK
ncbi:MAG: aquaporin Z [Pseudomonadota bacterium]